MGPLILLFAGGGKCYGYRLGTGGVDGCGGANFTFYVVFAVVAISIEG
jgi:hypothetical protein